MHVLIIVSWYKTESNPVAGSFFEEQARALQKFGCTVGLLHIGFKKFSDRQARLDRTFDDRGLFTMQYESRALLPKKENINYLYLCKRAYKKYQKYSKVMGKPDIIHAHSVFWGGIAARYISQKTNIPYIITEHLTNFILGKINSKTDIDYAKKVFSDSSANIAVSSSFKKELSEKLNLNEGKCLVVHNLVSSIFFQNRVQKVIREIEPIRFFTNSFISERKNILLLIESFSIFCKIYPQSQLIIGGDVVREFDTGYKERLLERVESLNIKEKIFFLGPLSREQVKSEIDQCHVFLLG
ncbi:MAG TPA: glycosyltransferase, partial [Bacteroidia bacterium]